MVSSTSDGWSRIHAAWAIAVAAWTIQSGSSEATCQVPCGTQVVEAGAVALADPRDPQREQHVAPVDG